MLVRTLKLLALLALLSFGDCSPRDLVLPARTTDEPLAPIRSDPSNKSVRAVSLDLEALADEAFAIELGGRTYEVTRTDIERREDGSYSWFGRVDGGSAALVVDGARVTGIFRTRDRVFELRPLDGRVHVIIERDPSALPPDDPSGDAMGPAPAAPTHCSAIGSNPGNVQHTIDLIVAYTPAAIAARPDMRAWIQLQADEANRASQNSKVMMRFRVRHAYETAYVESTSLREDRDRFIATGDGHMDEIHSLREQRCADVALLITDEPRGACGIAAGLDVDASRAFAVVSQRCFNLTFAHEIGHLMCAAHDVANAGASGGPYTFGHGFFHHSTGGSDPSWRTVMSYECTPGSCPRVPHWSNPNVSRNGHATGTATREDNARVLNGNRARVSAFKWCGPDCHITFERFNVALGAMLHFCGSEPVDPRCFDDGCPLAGFDPWVRATLRPLVSGPMVRLSHEVGRVGRPDAEAWLSGSSLFAPGAPMPGPGRGGKRFCEGMGSTVGELGKILVTCGALIPP